MKIKQGHTIVGAVVLVLAAAIAWAQSTSTPHTARAVIGTWELVSHDYNGQQAAPSQRQVKINAPGHFMWVTYDKDKMKTVGAGTGSWPSPATPTPSTSTSSTSRGAKASTVPT
jgi:hypothetical protein